jgi:uroporphyrinogen-III synthase
MRITPVAGAVDLAGAQALLFTSANGVTQFAARSPRRDLPALCVGETTAETARDAGFGALSADGDVDALAALAAARLDPEGGALVHVRGRRAAGDLVGRLRAAGFDARGAEIYEQATIPMPAAAAAALAGGGVDAVALFSPRSAALFAKAAAASRWDLGRAAAVSLGAAADAAVAGLGFGRRRIAEAPTRAALIEALTGL